MKEITREEFLKLSAFAGVGGALGGAAAVGGYLWGQGQSERERFSHWPEERLLIEGGAQFLGSDSASFQMSRGGVSTQARTEARAYRLPPNINFDAQSTTSIALLSKTRFDATDPTKWPSYDAGVIFIPAPHRRPSYWHPGTKGDHVFDFDFRLSLGVSPEEVDELFYPRLNGVDYRWGKDKIPSYDDEGLLNGELNPLRYPTRLVAAPHFVQYAPNRWRVVNNVPSIVYYDNRMKTVPSPTTDAFDKNKPVDSNFVIADMGSIKLVNGLGRPYSVISDEIVDGNRMWRIDDLKSDLDKNEGTLLLRSRVPNNGINADFVARVNFISGIDLGIFDEMEANGHLPMFFDLSMSVNDKRTIDNLGGNPVYAASYFLTASDANFRYDSADAIENVGISIKYYPSVPGEKHAQKPIKSNQMI